MKLHITLPSICRPHEYKSFLEQHFLDAVLNYESDPETIKRLLAQDKWENRRIRRKGRDVINKFITEKEKANLKVEWHFE
jgi:hypothetical protein